MSSCDWCEGLRAGGTLVAATDIPRHVILGSYPGGLDFAAQTTDRPAVDHVIKVAWRGAKLNIEEEVSCVRCRSSLSYTQQDKDENLWMAMMQPARDRHEQNVEMVLESGRLLLHTVKPVQRGDSLLVWYSDLLARAFGVPILTPAQIQGDQQYRCTGCYATFQYPNTLKAHMLFKCSLVNSSKISNNEASTIQPDYSIAFLATPFHKENGCSSFSVKPLPSYSTPRIAHNVRGTTDCRRIASIDDSLGSKMELVSTTQTAQKAVATDHRPVTPDSSTDQNRSLNPNARKMICSSTVPTPITSFSPDKKPCPAEILSGSLSNTEASAKLLKSIAPSPVPISLDQHSILSLYYPWISPLQTSPKNFFCGPLPGVSECRSRHLPRPRLDKSLLFLSRFSESVAPFRPSTTPQQKPVQPVFTSTHSISSETGSSGTLPQGPQGNGKTFLHVPSEREKEPLDMLPPSLFTTKSRRGHLCIYCGKMYSRKYGLKIHLRTHTGYKPLKCKVCLRPFGDPSNLNKHVRLHAEGDTPYRCDFCGKVLVRRRDLERHVRSRHPPNVTDDINRISFVDSEPEMISESESSPSPCEGHKL